MKRITVTEKDLSRITVLLEGVRPSSERDTVNQRKLHAALSVAKIVQSRNIPENVITMNSTVCARDPETGAEMIYTLVYPEMADYRKGFVSILAPLGMALIGSRAGETIRWEVPKGEKRLEIVRVLYQPEINGNFNL